MLTTDLDEEDSYDVWHGRELLSVDDERGAVTWRHIAPFSLGLLHNAGDEDTVTGTTA